MGEILCLKEKSRGRLKPIWPTLVSSPGRPYLRLLSRPEQTFTHFCGQTSLRVGEYISSFFFMTRPRRRFSRSGSEKNIGFIGRVKRSARLSQKKTTTTKQTKWRMTMLKKFLICGFSMWYHTDAVIHFWERNALLVWITMHKFINVSHFSQYSWVKKQKKYLD